MTMKHLSLCRSGPLKRSSPIDIEALSVPPNETGFVLELLTLDQEVIDRPSPERPRMTGVRIAPVLMVTRS